MFFLPTLCSAYNSPCFLWSVPSTPQWAHSRTGHPLLFPAFLSAQRAEPCCLQSLLPALHKQGQTGGTGEGLWGFPLLALGSFSSCLGICILRTVGVQPGGNFTLERKEGGGGKWPLCTSPGCQASPNHPNPRVSCSVGCFAVAELHKKHPGPRGTEGSGCSAHAAVPTGCTGLPSRLRGSCSLSPKLGTIIAGFEKFLLQAPRNAFAFRRARSFAPPLAAPKISLAPWPEFVSLGEMGTCPAWVPPGELGWGRLFVPSVPWVPSIPWLCPGVC